MRLAADGRVSTFLEKPRPEEIDTNLINAGMYVLEPEVLGLVTPGRPVSIERDVFPKLAEEGSVFGIALDGYWLDVGTPEAYLQAHRDVLERSFSTETGDSLGPDFTLVDESAKVHPGARLVPPVYIGPGAVVEDGARAGSLAVLGAGSHLARGALVENAVVGARSTIGAATAVVGSIVGDDADVGPGCEVRNLAVIGPGREARPRQCRRPRTTDWGRPVDPRPGSPVLVTPAGRFVFAPRKVEKPWGWELVWAETETYVGKLLFVRAGEALSLQYHEEKDESWLVREGRVRIDLGAPEASSRRSRSSPGRRSTSLPARFTASPRSRTRSCSRSRRHISTTS